MQIVRSIEEDHAEAGAIGVAHIKEVARALFAPKNLNLVAVGPWKADARRQVEKLVREYQKGWQ